MIPMLDHGPLLEMQVALTHILHSHLQLVRPKL
jgi:hypothetical protein